jgi:hypothetical protein
VRVVLYNRRQILPFNISFTRISGNIALIILSWLFSILLVIPVPTKFDSIVYLPLEFYCLVSLSSHVTILYLAIIGYLIPMSVVAYLYIRVVQFVHHLPNHSQTSQIRRDVRAVRRIVVICCVFTILTIPTIILFIQDIITGKLYPLAYRIQALTVAVTTITISVCLPIVNSLFTIFSSQFVTRAKPQARVHPISILVVINNNHPQQLNTTQ